MFHLLLIQPLYNAFVFLIDIIPGGDIGLAIIIITLVVRAIFYPLFAASIRTSMAMQAVKPQLDDLNSRYKDDLEERSKRTMALYREHRIRPFSTILAAIVQLLVFIGLYYALFRTGLPDIDPNQLYAFVPTPETAGTHFLGFVNLFASKNIALAAIVGALQYLVMRYSLDRMSFGGDHAAHDESSAAAAARVAKDMQKYLLLYFLPGLMTVITFIFPAAVGLYFAVSSAVSLGQEWLIRREPL